MPVSRLVEHVRGLLRDSPELALGFDASLLADGKTELAEDIQVCVQRAHTRHTSPLKGRAGGRSRRWSVLVIACTYLQVPNAERAGEVGVCVFFRRVWNSAGA